MNISSVEPPDNMAACILYTGIGCVAVVSILGILGLTGNLMVLRIQFKKMEMKPAEIYMCALAVLDVIYNTGGLATVIWYDYVGMVLGKPHSFMSVKISAYICCFLTFTSLSYIFLLALERFTAVYFPFYRGRTNGKARTQLLVAPLLVGGLAYVAWYIPLLYIIVYPLAALITMLYGLVLFKVVSANKKRGKEGISKQEISVAINCAAISIISIVLLIPCTITFQFFIIDDFQKWVLSQFVNCNVFVLINTSHHPLLGINYMFHPYLLFVTSNRYKQSLKSIASSTSQMQTSSLGKS